MGEANRRKKSDPNYGVPKLGTKLSKLTGKKTITIEFQSRETIISTHVGSESLEFGFSQCQKCLASIPKERWQNAPTEAFDEFMMRLITDYDYPDEDEIVGVIRNGAIDSSLQIRNEKTAEVNIKTIQSEGKRLFTEPLTDFDDKKR